MPLIQFLNITDNGMIFDPKTGESFQLNESGKQIIQLLLQDTSLEKTAQMISESFAISYDRAWNDIQDFIIQLKILGLTNL